ncbi:hypothetical protein ACFOEE_10955 [Pseudoalteromonas fenneropenaei]|uniref:Uncharacterized protein n=1 Tax=Pseudoalteromonas fenneropenaei TaxID=1737459 RepID=A0ABV7CKP7_9GAMM
MLRIILAILLFGTLLNVSSREAVVATWQTVSIAQSTPQSFTQQLSEPVASQQHIDLVAYSSANKSNHGHIGKASFGQSPLSGQGLKHQLPAPHPVELPERSRLTHPSYFLHPEQQPDYQLLYALAEPDIPRVLRFRQSKPLAPPWYKCASRPRTGAIDNCQPANLTYRARLTYQLNA